MLLALALFLAPACSSEDGTRLIPLSDAQTRLNQLRTKPKFVADTLYPGAATETDRVEAEKVINKLIARLAVVISQTPTRERVLAEIERTLPSLPPRHGAMLARAAKRTSLEMMPEEGHELAHLPQS